MSYVQGWIGKQFYREFSQWAEAVAMLSPVVTAARACFAVAQCLYAPLVS